MSMNHFRQNLDEHTPKMFSQMFETFSSGFCRVIAGGNLAESVLERTAARASSAVVRKASQYYLLGIHKALAFSFVIYAGLGFVLAAPAILEKQKVVPMIFRRHGDTEPKNRGHALGNAKPATFYIRELERQGDTGSTTLLDASVLMATRPFNPKFIAYDKRVLRFEAYFLEAVHESNLENYRVRRCEVLYYLEDDTLQITEPKVENSGILQGNFVKRHRIPMPESDDRVHVPPDEAIPRDPYTVLRQAHMARETGQDPDAHYGKKKYPMKDFMEASLGKFARPSDNLRRFLAHDRELSKDPERQACAAVCDEAADDEDATTQHNYYSWEDLAIGEYLQIYNRRILLLDADASTRSWYEGHNMPLARAITVKEEVSPPPVFTPPGHDGLGSEEDSLQSCYHLLPKAPLKSIESLDTTECVHYEFIQRNSGIVGGKFLERTRIKRTRPDGSVVMTDGRNSWLGLDDFYVGARVRMTGRTFVLFEMDEYSAKYMEARPAKFARSDKLAVLRKVHDQVDNSALVTRISELQKKQSQVDVEELTSVLNDLAVDVAQHDAFTIIRNYGDKTTMKIDLGALPQLLLAVDIAQQCPSTTPSLSFETMATKQLLRI
ncbi:Protein of unknown function DUF1126 [Phytophthora cactorum]|nr:Protein of unknown function DUF1126 [Phytophthora cactorum]